MHSACNAEGDLNKRKRRGACRRIRVHNAPPPGLDASIQIQQRFENDVIQSDGAGIRAADSMNRETPAMRVFEGEAIELPRNVPQPRRRLPLCARASNPNSRPAADPSIIGFEIAANDKQDIAIPDASISFKVPGASEEVKVHPS